MKLDSLKLNPDNPRIIKGEKFKKLCQSLKDFPKMMELRPIVVDKDMMILGGNMRYRALQELGFIEIPDNWVKIADQLTEAEKKRFIIEDNLLFGEWDWDKLMNEWTDFPLAEWGFDLFNNLFVDNKMANDLWTDMPEFEIAGEKGYQDLIVHFSDSLAVVEFSELVKQKITKDTRFIYFPCKKKRQIKQYCIKSLESHPLKYPVFVISKGRWKSRLTVKSLEEIGVPYKVVIEPQEFEEYSSVIDKKNILILPFSNLGQGSIPVRNWVWDFARSLGVKRYWILDDNIRDFYRSFKGVRIKVADGTIFRCAEDFVDRFENVPMAGLNYSMFGFNRIAPFTPNTRIYSCILLETKFPLRWRGRYNEDTDLSLRILKAGYCTILFNVFLCGKVATMRMRGGNTDELYKKTAKFDGRLEMAKTLLNEHPDVVKIVRKWGRWQHSVDYSSFEKNRFFLVKNRQPFMGKFVNEYGMKLFRGGKMLEFENEGGF
jgi:hypothetical protein